MIVTLLGVWLIYRNNKNPMTDINSYSQANQDIFILNILNGKRNGYYLEIGGGPPILINNTYLLSKNYDWKGITVEYDDRKRHTWKDERPNDIIISNDARKINYLELLQKYNAPHNIDYLQIDLEVNNRSTLDVLELMDREIFDYYKFAVVTFEHDIYLHHYANHFNTRNIAREIFKRRGYFLVFPDLRQFEDWYVHPDLVDMKYVYDLVKKNKKYIDKQQEIFQHKGGLNHSSKELIAYDILKK